MMARVVLEKFLRMAVSSSGIPSARAISAPSRGERAIAFPAKRVRVVAIPAKIVERVLKIFFI